MRRFVAVHRETGLTLRQYAKLFPVAVRDSDRPVDCADKKITYVVSEGGGLGFYYLVPWEGVALYWLDRGSWEERAGEGPDDALPDVPELPAAGA